MATDALELDEEDVQDEHPSYVVSVIMQDEDNVKKLEELNLDDFAVSMYEANQDRKRRTLDLIKKELIKPFGDRRAPFSKMSAWDVLTMLTGQTQRTLRIGFIIPVAVIRTRENYVHVRHDSGIEGIINTTYLTDDGKDPGKGKIVAGSTFRGMIIDIKLDLHQDEFRIELSARPSDLKDGDSEHRRVKHDDAWDYRQFEHDRQMQERKKRAEVGQARRVIKHPNFHNFTSSQAETFLASQQRGDVVIRPSSTGLDHLAVTWKVDDDLYQHIDVVEPNSDPTVLNMGTRLFVYS
jgi:transcription elongation factor SPT6